MSTVSYFTEDYGVRGHNAVALEDSIMQKGKQVTANSKILEGFVSPFNATVAERLINAQFTVAGKTSMNEFGIPSLLNGQTEVLGAVKAVSDGAVDYALCNDIFGQYRKQAAENSCCYIHPTYGTVSRFGIIPLACSMDRIGVVCKSISDGFNLLSKIAGNDCRDGAMYPEKTYKYEISDKRIRIGIPKAVTEKDELFDENVTKTLGECFQTVNMELENFDVYKQVMYILSCAEISNNISRYDGVKFGYRTPAYRGVNELYINTRSEGFGTDVKLTALMGAMVLSQENYVPYYEKAMKVRRLIKNSLRFDNYDVIVLPCSIGNDPYENLSLYALSALVGLPSVTFKHNGHNIQLVGNVKREDLLLTAWEVCRHEL